MLRRAAAIGRQGTGSSQIAPPACSALGATQQRLRRLRALATSSGGGSPRRHFASSSSSSSRPDGHETGGAASSLHNGEDGEDEEADEEEEMERLEGLYREQMALMDERMALGKALLDPAWMHGRRRISAPPQEGVERMNELSRLLSGRQIRLHASRLSRRPGGAAQQQQRRRPPRAEGDAGADDEEEDWGVEDEDENEGRGKGEPHDADADADADEDEEADALLEGEAPQGQYYRNSALAKPRWAGRAASPPEALAYLATRAVPNFSVALRVLREAGAAAARAGLAGGGATPASVLDVGCGPGSGLLAARTLWGGGGGRLRRLDGVDHSGAMRDLARHLLEPDAVVGGGQAQEQAQAQGQDGQQQPQQEPPAPVTLHRHLPPLAQQAARTGERYDVVLASWTLSELPSDASRALAVGLMWELVATNGGVLVLVEDGSPEGSRLVRSARRLVLEKRGPPEGGRGGGGGGAGAGAGPDAAVARTLAPCPHDRPCPLLRDDWCRFTQRVPLGRLPRGAGGGGGGHGAAGGGGGRRGGGGGGYKDVAFSYVVLQKGRSQGGAAVPGTENCDADARLAALRRLRVAEEEPERGVYAPTEADWEAATEGVPSRNGWARLIRNPKKAKGHVHLDLCLPTGRLERRVVAKSAAKRLPGKYVAARKAQWGGLWPAAKDV